MNGVLKKSKCRAGRGVYSLRQIDPLSCAGVSKYFGLERPVDGKHDRTLVRNDERRVRRKARMRLGSSNFGKLDPEKGL